MDSAAIRAAMQGLSPSQQEQFVSELEKRSGKTPPISDAAIQTNVESAPSQESGGLETALGIGLTGGLGALNPEGAQGLGRGAMDASARMVNNVQGLFGGGDPALNAQLNPGTPEESIGQFLPSMAMAASGGSIGTGAGVAADTGSPLAGLAAGVGGAALGPLVGKAASLSPLVKLQHVKALSLALAGFPGKAVRGLAMDAGQKAIMSQLAGNIGEKAAEKLITLAQRQGAEAVGRQLWKLMPPAIAHGATSEASYSMTDKLLNADSPKALADIAKRRQHAQSVLR